MKIDSSSVTPEKIIYLNLTMSEREADALLTIVSRVGGNRAGPRGVADSIARVLRELDCMSGEVNTDSGSTYFPDTWAAFSIR